ncbi:MAG: amino acid ABC transporter substrate-binding protein [Balneolaceae bacterium]|nr:MAG: amino acid ABC transporter substrate-binding protein [Balneolaceae bacterium]
MKFIYIIFMLALIPACTSDHEIISQNASNWLEVQQRGYGTVTLAFVSSDGFSYTDNDGNLTGVTIELVRDFIRYVNKAYDVNIEINYYPVDNFSGFYNYVKEAESGVFGVANVTITEERRNELQFSPPYMTNIATLITHSDIPEIRSFDEIPVTFTDLKALAFEGTLHQDRLENIRTEYLPDADIVFAQSNNEIIERASAQNRYFAYVDIYNYWRAAEHGAPLRRHAAGDESSEEFGIIMPLDSDWVEVIEEFFEYNGGYVQTSRYRELMEKHLGKELADLLLKGY